MGKGRAKSILLEILYIILIFSFMGIIGSVVFAIYKIISDFQVKSFIYSGFVVVSMYIWFMIIKYLTEIVETTYYSPFVRENVTRLKKMGYYLIANVIFEWITRLIQYIIGPLTDGYTFEGNPTFTYFILALLCFVVAEVFNKAIKIKEENDWTI
ncbi:DUF2975 domain-containing protein [Clostridium oceanicum]|uniref:DUF2975 domain-containing protein n=1 Tax=Clostridium oceanicum TaxID=1543 RepID=A0ABP3V4J1_9CLOT